MKRLLLFLFFPLAVFAQPSNTGSLIGGFFAHRPVCSGNVSDSNAHNGDVYSDTDDGNFYKCAGGTWWTVGGRTTGQATSANPAVFDSGIHAGSDIHVDIRAYGAYATFSSTTCNTTNGSSRVGLGAASKFKNGEYATCYNAGGATTTSTPSAPTVTPCAHAGGMAAVADNVGSTAYAYKIVAEDKNNGRSAASTAGSTATGNVGLGQTTIYDFSRCTRSNQAVTCTTTATHSFVVGQQIWTQHMTDHTFNGNWIAISPTSGTTVTWKSNWDTRMGAPTSTTQGSSGNVWGWKMNRLTWTGVSKAFRYHIYGPNCPATCNWMGQTVLTQWDDYGPTMMAGQARPAYIPTAAPSSSANQHFTFKINSGGGTATLTADSNAGVTGSSRIVSDVGPPLVAAAAKAKSIAGGIGNTGVLVPIVYTEGSGYFWQVNSYTDLAGLNADIVLNGGGLILNQPLANAYKVEGTGGGTGLGNFGWDNYPSLAGSGYPMIYSQTRLKHIYINPSNGNGALAIYALTPTLMNYDDFYLNDGSGTSDCIGQAALYNSTSTAFDWNWNRFTIAGGLCGSSYSGSSPVPTVVSLATGSGQVGNSPTLTQGWMLNRASVDVDSTNGACEPLSLNAASVWTQNSNEPILQASGVCNAGVFVGLAGVVVADYATPVFANYAATNQGTITINGAGGLNGTATGYITGNPINSIVATGIPQALIGGNIFMQYQAGPNFIIDPFYGGQQPELVMNEHQAMGPGFGIFSTGLVGAAPTCATISAGPPYVPAGTYTFQYAVAYANGGTSRISNPSNSCTANGTSQQINITIPKAIPGAVSYYIWSGNTTLTMSAGCGSPMTTVGPTAWTGSNCGGVSPPSLAGGGPAGMMSGNLWALDHILGATTAPAGSINTTQLYMDSSTLWPSFKPNGNRAYVIPGISGPVINGHNLCADGTSGAYVDCLTTQTIASGTARLGTSAIAANSCATVITTAATGVVTADAISYSFSAAPSGAYITGLFVQSYVTPGNVNFLVCNPTTQSLTPPGANLNWRVTR
jgi:hypothetical protein